MKRLLSFFLTLFIILPAFAQSTYTSSDGIKYELDTKSSTAKVTYVVQSNVSGPGTRYPAYPSFNNTEIILPETVTVSGKMYTVTSIGTNAFAYCQGLVSIFIPKTVTTISSNAFLECNNLVRWACVEDIESSNLPTSGGEIRYPKDGFFEGKIFYGPDYQTIYWANRSYTGQLSIKSSVTTINNYAFYGCSDISSLTIPQSVITIGDYAFYGCSDISGIIMPQSVNTIGDYAFYGCSNISGIIIPQSATSIGDYAFQNTENVTEIYIQPSDEMLTIGETPFTGTGATFLLLGRDLSRTLGATSFESVELDNKVTSLPPNAFKDCSGLKELTMPDPRFGDIQLKNISQYAFSGCTSLTSISLPNTIEHLDEGVFYNCSLLKSVDLPIKLTEISTKCFYQCSSLTDITLTDGITSIGIGAFYNCGSLPTINLPEGLTEIQGGAFYKCTLLDNIILPSTLNTLGDEAFEFCETLSEIVIPNSVNTIGAYCFAHCSSLASVKLPDKLTEISDCLFGWCTSLQTIVIPESVTSIHYRAFYICKSLKDIRMPSSLENIGLGAFIECDLESIMLPSTLTEIGRAAFGGNENLLEIYSFNTTPPVCEEGSYAGEEIYYSVFSENTKKNAKLYIPTASYNNYRTSYCWKDFTTANIEPLNSVSSIEIEAPSNRLRINKTMLLNAVVAPDDTQFTDVTWSSSNPNVASISADGTVTAVSPGYTVITAKSKSIFAVEGIFQLQVIDFLIGDSNESDFVTVTDAVNIASFVMGKKPEVFNFEASDVNESGDITLADASGVITIVLDQTAVAPEESSSIMKSAAKHADFLLASDFSLTGAPAAVPVSLSSTTDFIALQADIRGTGGVEILGVTASEQLSASHSFSTRRLDNGAVRVVIFSPNLSRLPAGTAPLFEVTAGGTAGDPAAIEITDILATDSSLHEYGLGFEGGNCTGVATGIDTPCNSGFSITTGPATVTISGAAGAAIRVFAANGTLSAFSAAAGETETFSLNPGLYIVTINEKAIKVTVR